MKSRRPALASCFSLRYVLLGCVGLLVVFQAYIVFRATVRGRALNLRFVNDRTHWEADLLHLNWLNEQCLTKDDTVIMWTSAMDLRVLKQDTNPSELLAALRQCPEVDIFLPVGIRSHGYCEDAMAYVKFLETRALPMWVLTTEFRDEHGSAVSYFDLCPHAAIMFMNHYWDGVDALANFPATKKIVLMPNIEMYELKAAHYQRADFVLAKTHDANRRITEWYAQPGNNIRQSRVIFAQHTSSDPTAAAVLQSRHSASFGHIAPKNFETLTAFHANGRSTQKNTPKILQCWVAHPEYPQLHIYSSDDQSKQTYDDLFGDEPPANLVYHHGEFLAPATFGKLLAEASIVLCPSIMEGYGHYINQARAAGALVVTTDAAPMNEFVDADSGVLVGNAVARSTWGKVLMGNDDTEFDVEPTDICDAMDRILAMTPNQRATKAKAGEQRYFDQLAFFRDRMAEFRCLLRQEMDT
ncbi:Aste57867_24290 [Aphanomyces stellatus]|uniref:Aste57867_24290 protein n=1 Tax=Aphanomyces stellatus TaxID=120398 RepID=A0A485LQS1_9STRA|nr:hypothetical protein As57867_024215 [Aphanomyces stellatus]VFU00930.1 Aste57867_24290 [Aphanomyces stellatus]